MREKDGFARLAVDVGGTFTDLVIEHQGRRATAKVLTTPRRPEEAILTGIREILSRVQLSADAVGLLVHGTTLATNALIERKGARTALITTEGFRDALEMAYENRFEQYDLNIERPPPLVPRYWRFTVPERINARGDVLRTLDQQALRGLVPILRDQEIESVAIGFLHSYVNSAHELQAGAILSELMPDVSITLSSDISPEIREYDRLSTACANAYIQPLMASYLQRLEHGLREIGMTCPVFLMLSSGGITTLEVGVHNPIRLVEGGPAGGAILSTHIAAECGASSVVSFDMGGTTAKICLIDDGKPQTSRTFEVARAYRFLKGSGLPLRIPVIEMVEIGAGGGSVAHVDSLNRLTIGPDSAGSEPGPVCYARGGAQATVTDADLVLGYIDPGRFAGGRIALDVPAAERIIESEVGKKLGLSNKMAAYGISEIAIENMASAARLHAIERGKSLEGRTLVVTGGAAPLHAIRLADKLGISRLIIPTNAGVGSAVGFLRAPVSYEVARSRYQRLDRFEPGVVNELFARMLKDARAVVELGAPGSSLHETRSAFMRYVGQGHEINVPIPVRELRPDDTGAITRLFEEAYRTLYGRTIPHLPIEVLSWTLQLAAPGLPPQRARQNASKLTPKPIDDLDVFDGRSNNLMTIPLYRREALLPGSSITGPAIVVEEDTSIVLLPHFNLEVHELGHIVLERRAS